MTESFYFYDLETSGLDPRTDRIMQFAGQRTDLSFQPLGDPDNLLIALPDDTLPSPGAIMVTGITPSATRLDGISEREFGEFFLTTVATPGTTIIGYNSVRFDDEFIRHLLWRNFADPYEWQWKDGRSRWDLLDVVRLTRALRPDGINWPVTPEGRPTNRLELITKENQISHAHAHDALSDVEALISVTKLIKERQPQLFDYLFDLRNKRAVENLVNLDQPQPFVYASGRYPSEFGHTTVAYPIAPAANGNVLVFDLRYNLDDLLARAAEAASDASAATPVAEPSRSAKSKLTAKSKASAKPFLEREPWERGYFPIVKKLQYNRCPAVAPLGVLEKSDGWSRLQLTPEQIKTNLAALRRHPEFIARMADAETARAAAPHQSIDPESALYDGFLNDQDRRLAAVVRANGADDLADFHPNFDDERLPELLLHYKAKNFPTALSADEQERWEAYRRARLERQAPKFLAELERIGQQLAAGQPVGNRSLADSKYLFEELNLWYQSLA